MKQMRNLLTGIFLMLGMLLTTLPVVAQGIEAELDSVAKRDDVTSTEQESIGAVAVVVEEPGSEGDGQAPDDAERAPDKAAAAHPDTGGDAAEYGFCNIAQKCADDEEKNDFVETDSSGEYARFLFSLANWSNT